jgi:hypothetical protein
MYATVSSVHLTGNHLANLQIEANQGPITVEQSTLCYGSMGVIIVNTGGLRLSSNTFYGNGAGRWQGQIFLAGNPGGRLVTNWQTGQTTNVYTEYSHFDSNVVIDSGWGQYVFATYLSGTDWNNFANTLWSNYNNWHDSTTSSAFMLPSRHTVTLSGWRSTLSTDWQSSWYLPSTNFGSVCATPNPSTPDFIVYADNPSYSVRRGQTAVYPISLVPFGFSGPVSFAVYGLPSGARAWFASGTLTTSGTNQLSLFTPTYMPTGTYPITILATGGGMTRAVTVTLTVT